MLKRILLSLLLAFSLLGSTHAQVSTNLPNGSFEQWSIHPGYNIDVFSMSLPLFDSFPTPTGWGYLAYPVNESISLGFASIDINTVVPLVVASQDTGAVPDGNYAVKLETFMLSDIIDPDIVTLAADYLDTSLTNTVIPSILTTGEVNVERLVPIITDLMSNGGDLFSGNIDLMALLDSITNVDVNQFITGGIPVDDYMPSHLTGSYKYHSAVGGDNGGVLMIGTHYNTTLGMRQVVGFGLDISLDDSEDYTPFEAEYLPIDLFNANISRQKPDSMIVILVSSASLNRQQGSYLCVDDLVLWLDTASVVEPDTCATIISITLDSSNIVFADNQQITGYSASWQSSFNSGAWEVEYRTAGFEPGAGISDEVESPYYAFGPLQADSQYELRVRSVCGGDVYGEWKSIQFRTATADPGAGIDNDNLSVRDSQPSVYPNPANGRCVVSMPEDQKSQISVYSLDGSLLQSLVSDSSSVSIDLPTQGIFMLKIVTPQGTYLRKVVNK